MNDFIILPPNIKYGSSKVNWNGTQGDYNTIRLGKKQIMEWKLNADGSKGRHPYNIITEETYDE